MARGQNNSSTYAVKERGDAPFEDEGKGRDGGRGNEVAVDEEDEGAHAGVEGQLADEQRHHREHLHQNHAQRQHRRLERPLRQRLAELR